VSLILALDTATNFVGVALGDADGIVGVATVAAPRQHAEVMVPTIVEVLAAAGVEMSQVSALAVGVGPGLFTGLRVGVTTAIVMAEALAVPLVAVSSLELVAAGCHSDQRIVVVLDAKRSEVFHATFHYHGSSLIRDRIDAVADPSALVSELIEESAARAGGLMLMGDGVATYPEVFSLIPNANIGAPEFWMPSATALVKIAAERIARGEVDSPRTVVPNYLRESDAVLPTERVVSR